MLCRSDLSRDRNSCTLVDTMIVIAFITIAFWFILLLMSLIYLFQHPLPNTMDGPLNLIQYEDNNEVSHESLVIKALHRPTVPRLSSVTTETKITTDEEKTREKKKINYAIETNATMTTITTSTTITKEWCLGIDFAPVNLNLSLPTPSELLRRDKPVYPQKSCSSPIITSNRCIPFMRLSKKKKDQVKQHYLHVQQEEQKQEKISQSEQINQPMLITTPFYNHRYHHNQDYSRNENTVSIAQRKPTPFTIKTLAKDRDKMDSETIEKIKQQLHDIHMKEMIEFKRLEKRHQLRELRIHEQIMETQNQLASLLSYMSNNDYYFATLPRSRFYGKDHDHIPYSYYHWYTNDYYNSPGTYPSSTYYTRANRQLYTFKDNDNNDYYYYAPRWS
ncbi:hypothetical protein RMATCC62417_11800 [Rhizopus microsporus]|nr:hypothetical protein RMATCC62417_11800 [Rhizopus microsporus]